MVPTQRSVATRLLAITFSIYFVVALAVTVAHMRFEYQQAKANIMADLKVFQTTFQPILSQMVWSINKDGLRKTVEGIAEAPSMAGVRLMPNGLDEVAVGDVLDDNGKLVRVSRLDKPESVLQGGRLGMFGYAFPIVYKHPDGREEVLGKGIFYSSGAIVFQRVKYGFAIIVINSLIKTVALWLIFSWLSNRLLRRPLARLTTAVQTIEPDRLEQQRIDLGARGGDELQVLATAYNGMLDRLQAARAELLEANRTLEHKVRTRTRKLEQALHAQQEFSEELERQQQSLNASYALLEERSVALAESNTALERTLDDLRSTQSHLVQSEKMASLGQLVAGVAHELNTPIGNARVTATILEDESKQLLQAMERGELRKSELSRYVESNLAMAELIARSCMRAADLISSFKQVAVDQTSEKRRRFKLRDLVDDNVAALRPSFRNTPWLIDIDIPADIECDSFPGPLGQVIVNLVQNAVFHAFDGRTNGRVRISTKPAGDAVVIVVADDGKGMSKEVLSHIFEPFYTTKMGQGGSGLGLSIVHNIVTGVLGGIMQASSEPGHGTQITVVIPLQAPQQAGARDWHARR